MTASGPSLPTRHEGLSLLSYQPDTGDCPYCLTNQTPGTVPTVWFLAPAVIGQLLGTSTADTVFLGCRLRRWPAFEKRPLVYLFLESRAFLGEAESLRNPARRSRPQKLIDDGAREQLTRKTPGTVPTVLPTRHRGLSPLSCTNPLDQLALGWYN